MEWKLNKDEKPEEYRTVLVIDKCAFKKQHIVIFGWCNSMPAAERLECHFERD